MPWDAWSQCSTSCGHGTRSRSRSCTTPTYAGLPCSGAASETGSCKGKHTIIWPLTLTFFPTPFLFQCVIASCCIFITPPIFQMKGNGQVGRIGHHVLQHVEQAHSFDQEATVVVCHAQEILARQRTATVLF